jgi:hypothetical protein
LFAALFDLAFFGFGFLNIWRSSLPVFHLFDATAN